MKTSKNETNPHRIPDDLSIPEFLKRNDTPAEIKARREMWAKRIAVPIHVDGTPIRDFNLPKSIESEGLRIVAEREAKLVKKKKRQSEIDTSLSKSSVSRALLISLGTFCVELSKGRPKRVRRRDAKLWCEQAGLALPSRFDLVHAAKVRQVIECALQQGTPGKGSRRKAKPG